MSVEPFCRPASTSWIGTSSKRTSTPGWLLLYPAMSSGSSVQDSVSGAATRTSPRRSSLRLVRLSSASSRLESTRRAIGAKVSPTADADTFRVVRSSRRTPTRFSSSLIRPESAACDKCMALAASEEAFIQVTRRTLLGTIAAGFAAGPHFPAFADGDWPSRVVRLVSPYGAGGASDISLRILAEQFGRSLNQQFIVENKPGAGT